MWQIDSGTISAFDSEGNFFTREDSVKVGRGNIMTENHTQWTLPDLNLVRGITGVNSTGHVYFEQETFNGINKIGTLNHNTDVFTEWIIPNSTDPRSSIMDSSDRIYFSTSQEFDPPVVFLGRLDPSTDTFTIWLDGPGGSFEIFGIDSSNHVFLFSNNKILEFNPENSTITEWPELTEREILSATVGSNGLIYFSQRVPINDSAITRLDTNSQTIKEWIIPNDGGSDLIAVDSSDNVFFNMNGLSRLVPSTNTITTWDDIGIGNLLQINSFDTIFWSGGTVGGTVT
jgi:streptogramin lyase